MLYLIHFQGGRLGGEGSKGASHYLGWASDRPGALKHRLREHRTGQGAAITRAAVERGLTLDLADVLPGDRHEERRLKRAGHIPERRCPVCKAERHADRNRAARPARREPVSFQEGNW